MSQAHEESKMTIQLQLLNWIINKYGRPLIIFI